MRGLFWPLSGPLSPGDALDAGRVDAPRLLRPPLLATVHHPCVLTSSLAAATAARGTAGPLARSTPDLSAPRPSPGSAAAIAWLSPSRGSAGAVATTRGGWHGASRNCRSNDTRSTAAVSPPRPCTTC